MRRLFHLRSLQDLVDLPDGGGHVSARALASAGRVPLPTLPTGQHSLPMWDVPIGPSGAHWTEDYYDSVAPILIEFHDVLVHGAAGIVMAGDHLISNTLHQVHGPRDGFALLAEQMVHVDLADVPVRVRGRHLSLLTGNEANYYHWMMDGIGRLAALPGGEILACDGVLHPEFTMGFQNDSFRRLDLRLPARAVPRGATIWVERMLIPWSVLGDHRPHPSIVPLFQRLAGTPAEAPGLYPQRLYIDRRGSANRGLRNEDEVVAALARLGFVIIKLENFELSAQIALFANAEIVVAPHGAGLTNLLFAGSQTRVVELLMDTWVNWCFRRLAALRRIYYDCVIGREDRPHGAPASDWPHDKTWTISVPQVLVAVEQALAG